MNIVHFVVHAVFWSLGFLLLFRIPYCRRQSKRTIDQYPRVSVIVPARNEEYSLPVLLASLRNSDFVPDETIVAVGQSEDATRQAAIVNGATVIDSGPLPDGWLGKPWACHRGAQLAQGDILVFLDADTCMERDGLRSIVNTYLEDDGVVSVAPYHRTRRLYEQLSAFFNVVMMAGTGAFTALGGLVRPIGLFGPCVVINRQDYLQAGGHTAVKGDVVEDLALGERLSEYKLPIRCYGGKGTISSRMYPTGIRDLVDGWSKGFAIGASKTRVPLLLSIIAWLGSGISAAVWVIAAIWNTDYVAMTVWGIAYLGYAIQLEWMFFRLGTFKLYTALLFPVPLLFFIAVFFRSLFMAYLKKSVRWKGITINLRRKAQRP